MEGTMYSVKRGQDASITLTLFGHINDALKLASYTYSM